MTQNTSLNAIALRIESKEKYQVHGNNPCNYFFNWLWSTVIMFKIFQIHHVQDLLGSCIENNNASNQNNNAMEIEATSDNALDADVKKRVLEILNNIDENQ